MKLVADVPDLQIRGGEPTRAEADAARAAIVELWRADQAAAARAAGASPWIAGARAEATRRSGSDLRARTASAWRWAGRVGPTVSSIQIGRGDAR
jgi:hypothetical protein